MGEFLSIIGILGFLISLIMLPVRIFKKKPKKPILIALLGFFILTIIGFSMIETIETDEQNISSNQVSVTKQELQEKDNDESLSDNQTIEKNQAGENVNDISNEQISETEQAKQTSSQTSSTNTTVNAELKVHFLDVGQADSILIQFPNGETALIDGGNKEDGEFVVGYIKNMGINKVDYIIATHPHEDHIGGLPEVIKNFDIGKIYMPNKTSNTRIFENLLKEIKNKGLKITRAKGGLSIIDTDDLKFTIIAPNSEKYDETNEYSIVNKLTYKNTSFIFTGDAEKDSEEEMIKLGYDLKADVLKVGHHGGRTSTNYEFLKRVNPKFAVISVGKDNDYGHPHKEVLERLAKMGIKVFRTDELGTIIATSDGDNIKFNKKPCEFDLKDDNSTDTNTSNINSVNTNNDSKTTETNTAINTNVDKNTVAKTSVVIKSIDLSKEIVIIQNTTNKDIDMTGWKLVSVIGNQTYYFPTGYILKAGATITIASGKSTGDLKWTSKNIWNNKGDTGILYDKKGNEVSRK